MGNVLGFGLLCVIGMLSTFRLLPYKLLVVRADEIKVVEIRPHGFHLSFVGCVIVRMDCILISLVYFVCVLHCNLLVLHLQ